MRASSQAALAAATDRWEAVTGLLDSIPVKWASDLFETADTLAANPRLRRALTNPNRDGSEKAELAASVLEGKVAPEVRELVEGLVRERWSEDGDVVEALEEIGISTALDCAQGEGKLEEVENEAYALGHFLRSHVDIRNSLADGSVDVELRRRLLRNLLEGKIGTYTLILACRYISPQGRHPGRAMHRLSERASKRHHRLLVSVQAATPLSGEQVTRLESILERRYERPVKVQVALVPGIIGGLRIRVGSDLIDGTVLSRINRANLTLTSDK